MIEGRWEENRDRIMNVDVRAPREFSHVCTRIEREQGRIDWRVRCSENMKRMKKHEFTPVSEIH